jgi:HJR/Mrr/RecB family endonuclease
MTSGKVATYISVFAPRSLPGTSAQYIHVDDYRRFRESFRTDDQWRAGRRLTESAEYPAPAPTPEPSGSSVLEGVLGEVYGALLHAGYNPTEYEPLLQNMDATRPVADLLREALRDLRRGVVRRPARQRQKTSEPNRSAIVEAEGRRAVQERLFVDTVRSKAAWRAAWEKDCELFYRYRAGYESRDGVAVSAFFHAHLGVVPLPAWCPDDWKLTFESQEGILFVECALPHFPSLRVMKTRSSKGQMDLVPASQKDAHALTNQFPYLLVLRLMWELVHVDHSEIVKLVCCNGHVTYDDPATGRPRRDIIMSVAAKPEQVRDLILDRVEPEACFRALKGVAGPRLSDMVPIQPVVHFDTRDKRFIAGKDVLQAVEGQNLATMDWQDFEHLIRELFEKEFAVHGATVRVTQASRDRGVDAVVFDPDPLRGGKTIIQAKRYTTTVDVSAVRDLLGTIHAEGANKGILVTTSTFGADSYSFAKDKPITLLNGANLLHYLEKHGYQARIDIKQARELLRKS